jgi:hypothetical protein
MRGLGDVSLDVQTDGHNSDSMLPPNFSGGLKMLTYVVVSDFTAD